MENYVNNGSYLYSSAQPRALKGRAPKGDQRASILARPYVSAPDEGAAVTSPSPLEAALFYASLGWAVFPADVQPFRPLVRRGCHDASKEPDVIQSMWRTRPAAGVAVATGAVSELIVLDIDSKHGRDGRASLAPLLLAQGGFPLTWISHTPSGGQHVFFRHPGGRVLNRVDLLPGVDVRADGGAVAAPPSGGGGYRWFEPPGRHPLADPPAWLLDLLTSSGVPKRTSPTILRFRSPAHRAAYAQQVVVREYERVANAPAGTRNMALFLAACRLGELIPALLSEPLAIEALERGAAASGLTADGGARSVRATIRSGLRRGQRQPREVI